MKQLLMSLCVLTLSTATGCNSAPRDTEEAAKPTSTETSNEPVSVVAKRPVADEEQDVKKPVAGEAEHTFGLSVPVESVALKQGEEVSVRIGIERGTNFSEEVEIEVTGLPAGVTVEAEQPSITKDSKGVDLKLKAAEDAALGEFTTKVTGSTKSSVADISKEIKLTITQK
jgi:uncharacterized membrane protein